MNTINLIKKLISIPSFVNDKSNEKEIGEYIYNYLKSNTKLVVKKDFVEEERFNVIAYSKNCIKQKTIAVDILFCDHIDTVEPKNGWFYNQFKGTRKDNRLFGLGVADTKSSVAVLMKIAEIIREEKCMFLFYIDEEYDFKGMKKFISDYKNKLKVRKIISTDGQEMKIRNSCRGLIELEIVCRGKSGHSSNPKNGISAISKFNRAIIKLGNYLNKINDPVLGKTSLNIAYLKAGLFLGKTKNGKIIVGKNGNNIPDYLEAVLEFRTNSVTSLEQIKRFLIGLEIIKIRQNIKPWITNRKKLTFMEKAIADIGLDVSFTDPSTTGYYDIAMLAQAFNSDCCCFSTKGGNGHGINEWVDIKSIFKLKKILKKILLINK